MKYTVILMAIFSLISCKKEQTNPIIGKWRILVNWNDVGGGPVPGTPDTFIEFRENGEFLMDTVGRHAYQSYLKGLNKYTVRNDGSIKFFTHDHPDSTITYYYWDNGLVISYGWISENLAGNIK